MSIPPGLSSAGAGEYYVNPSLLNLHEIPTGTRSSSLTSSIPSEPSSPFDDTALGAAQFSFYGGPDEVNDANALSNPPNLDVGRVLQDDPAGDLTQPRSPSLSLLPTNSSEVYESAAHTDPGPSALPLAASAPTFDIAQYTNSDLYPLLPTIPLGSYQAVPHANPGSYAPLPTTPPGTNEAVPSATSATLLAPFTPKYGSARYTDPNSSPPDTSTDFRLDAEPIAKTDQGSLMFSSLPPAFSAQQGSRRKRRLSLSPTPNHIKRQRADTETSHEVRHQPTLSKTLLIINQRALELYGSDPFTWSTASVTFALTSPSSIDLSHPPLQGSLPGPRVLADIFERIQINGPSLLLCTDAVAMYNYGITDQSSQKALADYIVRFRERSDGYLAYCYEQSHPHNFSTDCLILAEKIANLEERIDEYIDQTMIHLVHTCMDAYDIQYYHYPIGCLKVEKAKEGEIRFSFITAKQETLTAELKWTRF